MNSYQAALDAIYSTYMKAKPGFTSKLDRDLRDPSRILQIAAKMQLIPRPERVVVVAGSKGKGTVTRLISGYLGQACGESIGTLLSPEEDDHNDRMRIDGIPASKADFVRQFDAVVDQLASAALELRGGGYLSPSGIFLLMALHWFRERGVRHFVLEAGRGAQFDEVGNIFAEVGVITSVLPEHLEHLGPSLSDIARNKLHLAQTTRRLIVGPTVGPWLGGRAEQAIIVEPVRASDRAPAWLELDDALARCAAGVYLGKPSMSFEAPGNGPSNAQSFGKFEAFGADCIYEALVQADSIDHAYIAGLQRTYGDRVTVVLSLPDDKDVETVDTFFADRFGATYHIPLEGTRGYLNYDGTTRRQFGGKILGSIHYDSASELSGLIEDLARRLRPAAIVFIGTHTFIRLVRQLRNQR